MVLLERIWEFGLDRIWAAAMVRQLDPLGRRQRGGVFDSSIALGFNSAAAMGALSLFPSQSRKAEYLVLK